MTSPTQTSIGTTRAAPASWANALDAARREAPRIATWALPFVLVVYLGLRGGGYDSIVRGEVGVATWWVVLLGATIGILPVTGQLRAGWIGFALLAAFAAWTGFGIAWSSNAEASATEFARVATYFGVFVLVLSSRRPGDMRTLINGLACGMALIGILALLSRLHPAWFPTTETFPQTRNRLSYPIGYWNGLATLMAMAIPLLLFVAIQGRSVLGRAAAAASLPAVALTAFLTLSRGGAIEIVVALAIFLALAPRRLSVLPGLANAAVGSAILIVGAAQRDPLNQALGTTAAHQQGNEMLAMAIAVCGGVALVQVALALAARHGLGPRVAISREASVSAAAVVGVVAVVAALAVGGPGYLSDRWHDFKTPAAGGSTDISRFDSSTGGGRYQTWAVASDANETDPLIGIGPGNFENWWAENGTLPIFVRDAHSLYMETLGELGIVGLLLIAAFIVCVLGVGIRRAVLWNADRRWPYVAATASGFAFAVGAGIDWAWEQAVLPVAFLVLAGGLLARGYRPPSRTEGLATRAILVALGLAAMVAIAIPLLGSEAIRDSRAATASGNLSSALDHAKDAHDLQPYAATPYLQEALVLELKGEYAAALGPARAATRAAARDWRTWLVLSRLNAEAGRPTDAVAAYARARSLNPRSPLFANG